MTELIVASDPSDLVRSSATWLGSAIRRTIAERGACTVALAGGRTPEPVYRELASNPDIVWDRIEIFFSDERAVPPEDQESNYGMVRRALIDRVSLRSDRVHRMEAERPDRDAAAREYERLLPAHLDFLVLGIGPDGHTASLFPGSPAVNERHRLVLPVLGPKPPPERLTLTPPVIESAHSVVVVATGADKAPMVGRAIEGPYNPREVPAQLARRGTWFLDHGAASRLTGRRVPM